jgi:hypothetical protein
MLPTSCNETAVWSPPFAGVSEIVFLKYAKTDPLSDYPDILMPWNNSTLQVYCDFTKRWASSGTTKIFKITGYA